MRICPDFFCPRLRQLPCGHEYCKSCVAQLREKGHLLSARREAQRQERECAGERLERLELAAVHMEKAGRMLLAAQGTDPNASYENLVTVADLIHDRYRDPGRAAGLYRAAIALDGENPDAYYGLAASLQALDRAEERLRLIDDYIAHHGDVEKMIYAREILRNALGLGEN